MKRILFLVLLVLAVVQVGLAADVYVQGYQRKNGTYVQPHYRTQPDGDTSNNYSTPGNYNRNTGTYNSGGDGGSYGNNNYSNSGNSGGSGWPVLGNPGGRSSQSDSMLR